MTLLAVTAEAAASKVIAKGTNSKGLIAVASGTAKAPITELSYRVLATPTQTVKIDWTLLCQVGTTPDPGAGTPTASSEGSFTAKTPLKRSLKLPSGRLKRSGSTCVVSVYSSLPKKGKETVEILQS